MPSFRQVLTAAVFGGGLAGLAHALLHLAFLTPLLGAAESFEVGGHSHSHSDLQLQRHALTLGLSVSLYIGYGLILAALMCLARRHRPMAIIITAKVGLVWGLAGFIAVHLAPAFVLPLLLPGMTGAGLSVLMRQTMWLAITISTGFAAWWLAFGRGKIATIGGGLLALLPVGLLLILGDGLADATISPLPPQLATAFAGRSLAVACVAWLVLGSCVAKLLAAK